MMMENQLRAPVSLIYCRLLRLKTWYGHSSLLALTYNGMLAALSICCTDYSKWIRVWLQVVFVSRWYGGIQLGPDRFKHINNAARSLLVSCGLSGREPASQTTAIQCQSAKGAARGGGGSTLTQAPRLR
jgi:hypothetical protein